MTCRLYRHPAEVCWATPNLRPGRNKSCYDPWISNHVGGLFLSFLGLASVDRGHRHCCLIVILRKILRDEESSQIIDSREKWDWIIEGCKLGSIRYEIDFSLLESESSDLQGYKR
jgi:hypothetical protein